MRVLITGITGLLGAEAAAVLTSRGHQVLGVSRSYSGEVAGCRVVPAVYGSDSFNGLLADVDAVVHLAARRGGQEPIENFVADITTADNIIRGCEAAGVQTCVLASSISVYDPALTLPWSEDHTGTPRNSYGIAKLAIEQLGSIHAREGKTRVVSLRFGHLYGAFENTPHMINTFLKTAAEGKPLKVCPPSEKRRDMTYVADAAEAIALALGDENQPMDNVEGSFNIGSGAAVSNFEIAQIVSEVFNIPEPTIVDEWADTSIPSLMDLTRAVEVLKYQPAYDFVSGVTDIRNRLLAASNLSNS
ncbi:NAD(P)-dependent oxidoreductase [uncultured Corynebacterium sp.]|uniref:NAD-dependent epimerase/dehydratase family protein n=1 Tax=uncultured Corynebacterium sp. TaxID=159447 RepID=UPI00261F6C19|nr:NAD(P)-dependent oxidoreductase [uncultured Corynebacterium sp.]